MFAWSVRKKVVPIVITNKGVSPGILRFLIASRNKHPVCCSLLQHSKPVSIDLMVVVIRD